MGRWISMVDIVRWSSSNGREQKSVLIEIEFKPVKEDEETDPLEINDKLSPSILSNISRVECTSAEENTTVFYGVHGIIAVEVVEIISERNTVLSIPSRRTKAREIHKVRGQRERRCVSCAHGWIQPALPFTPTAADVDHNDGHKSVWNSTWYLWEKALSYFTQISWLRSGFLHLQPKRRRKCFVIFQRITTYRKSFNYYVLISRLYRTDFKCGFFVFWCWSSPTYLSIILPPPLSLMSTRRSISDVFRIQVVSNSDVRSPIITLGSTSFFHVRINNLYVVAVTKWVSTW